ncbi:hypothetical protein [Methylorubrum extorquens]
MLNFLATNKWFQFFAMMLSVATMAVYRANIDGSSELMALLYGLPLGYVLAEIWVASLLHGGEKRWTWFPVLRGRLRSRAA